MIISIVGDVDQSEANEIIRTLLKRIPQSGPVIAPLPEFQRSPVEGLAQREVQIPFDSQQAHIAMGMTAVTRNNPDYFPLLVGNYVLGGGGFVSRLMNEKTISSNYACLVDDLEVGQRVLIDDGNIRMVVTEKAPNACVCSKTSPSPKPSFATIRPDLANPLRMTPILRN